VASLAIAFRTLLQRPAFFAVAVTTLALGIGANAAVFTVFNAVLLAPLPYSDPARVVILTESKPEFPVLSVTRHNYDDWRTRAKSFTAIAAFHPTNFTVSGSATPERVTGKMITASLLPVLGMSVERGRGFAERDDRAGAEAVAILSAGFAERMYPDGQAVGRALQLDGQPYSIVGVMPPRFELFQAADVYVPFGPWAAGLPDDRGWHPGIFPIARLKDGVSLDEARVEMERIARQLETEQPEMNKDVRVGISPAQDLLVQNIRPALRMLLGAVAIVLLIACANVANLLLALAVDRQRDIAVRIALGASRARIVYHLLVESVLLACIGGAVGLLLASWLVSFLGGAAAAALPRANSIGMAWQVVAFAFGLSLLTGIVFGVVPALQATSFDVRETLKEVVRTGPGAIRQRHLRSALVVAEISLAVVLLVGAGLLLRSFSALTRVSPGFDPDNLLVVNLPLSPRTYQDPAVRTGAVERIVEGARRLPGVRNAAITTTLPMAGAGATIHFNRMAFPPRGPDDYVMAGLRAATPEYLATLGVPLLRGRLFTDRDREGAAPVVVVNEWMARQFFPDLDPIGQRIQLGTEPSPDFPTMEVVGVVGDMKQSFEAGAKAEMFVPYGQYPDPILTGMYLNTALVVRTTGDPATVVAPLRSLLRDVDRDQPLVNVRTMETAMANTVAQPKLQMLLIITFAGLAVVLAAVGVYGVMAYTVTQRVPEIGVRIAVGATPRRVIAMVVWQGARLTGAGMTIGLIAASFVALAFESMLFDVRGLDPITFAIAPVVLAASAMLASYIPARRASRISPVDALRR
jgi:putative ABC transport system permease protein